LEQALGAAATRQPPAEDGAEESPPGLIPPQRSPARRPGAAGPDADKSGLPDGLGLPPIAGLDQLGLGAALGLGGHPLGAGLPPPLSTPPGGGLGNPGAPAGLPGLGSLGSLAGLLPPTPTAGLLPPTPTGPPPPFSYQEYAAAMSAYAAATRGLMPPPYGSGCAPPGLHGAGRGLMPPAGAPGRFPPGLGAGAGLGAGPTLADFMNRPLGPPPTSPAGAGGLRGVPPCGAPAGLGGLPGTPSSAAALAAMAAGLAPAHRPSPAQASVRPGSQEASGGAARPPKVLSVTELEQQMLTSSLSMPSPAARTPPQASPLATTVPHTSLKPTPRAMKAGSAAIADLGLAAAWAGGSLPLQSPSAAAPATGTLPTSPPSSKAAEQTAMTRQSSQKQEDPVSPATLQPEACLGPVVPFLQRHRTALIAGSDKADVKQFIPPKDFRKHPQIMGASDKELVSRIQLSQLAALTTNPRLLFGQPLASVRIAAEAETVCAGFQRGEVPPKAVLQEKLLGRLKCDGEEQPQAGTTDAAPVILTVSTAAEVSAGSVVRTAQMQCEKAFAAVVELEQTSPQGAKADATPAEHERTEKAWREILPQIAAVIAPAASEAKGPEVVEASGSEAAVVPRPEPGEVCRNLMMLRKGRIMVQRLLLYLALAAGSLLPEHQRANDGAPSAVEHGGGPKVAASALLVLSVLWQVIIVLWLPGYAPKELLMDGQLNASWSDLQSAFRRAAGILFPRGGKLCLYALGALLGVVKVPLAASEAAVDDNRASEEVCRRVYALCSSEAGAHLVVALLAGRSESLPMQDSVAAALERQFGSCPSEDKVLDILCDALCRVHAPLHELATKKIEPVSTEGDAAGRDAPGPSSAKLEEEHLLELFLTLAESASERQMLQIRQCKLLVEIAQQ